MATNETWTMRRLLNWTADYLKQHGSESARLDAEILLSHVRTCDRIHLYTDYDEVASEEVRAQFRELVMRRAKGTPVAYLVGHKEFFSLEFAVTTDVLIPRPETEYLVSGLLDLAKANNNGKPVGIADIGTGSGILAICAALHIPGSSVTAVDVSEAAIEIASQNARKHNVSDRIEFVISDLFTHVDPQVKFDFILSNPPYVAESDRKSLARNVRDHEPQIALFAGDDGLDVIRRLIKESPNQIKPKGYLLFEIDPGQADRCCQLIEEELSLESASIIKDLDGRSRIVCVRRRDH